MFVCVDKIKLKNGRVEFNVIINERRFTALIDDKVDNLIFTASSRLIKNFTNINVFDDYFVNDVLIVGINDSIVLKDVMVDFVDFYKSRQDCDLLIPKNLFDYSIVDFRLKDKDNSFPCIRFNNIGKFRSFRICDGKIVGIDESVSF